MIKTLKVKEFEQKIYTLLEEYQDWFLRISLAVIYIWFGILKPFDSSPAADLVANSIYFLPREGFFIFLGIWETILGIMFLIPRFTKVTFWIFILHMGGTFTPFLTLPDTVFIKSPFSLSLEGQYIIKNLILISAGVAILINYLRKNKELAQK